MKPARTLIVTDRADFFMPKLLASVAADGAAPLPIDVLRYGVPSAGDSPQRFTDQVPMQPWPPGVQEFCVEGLEARVEPGGLPLDALLDRYDRIAVYSINPGNADLINHLVAKWPQEQLSVICSDDEIERHWTYQRLAGAEPQRTPARDAELRAAFLYPPAVQQAFEGMRRYFIGRAPWEAMLRLGRRSALELIPYVPPIINRIDGLEHVRRSADVYRVVLFPKPSVSREVFLEAARKIAVANAGRTVEIVSFRNDMPTLSQFEGLWLRCHPYPIDEEMYHRIIAASNGLVIVPRGGLSTIRDAVRYGLDLISLAPNTPNEITITSDFGLELTPHELLNIEGESERGRREANRVALQRYEAAAVAAFRNEYCRSANAASPAMNPDVANLVQRAIAARRLHLNTLVYQRLGGVVRYGPLAGMRLIEASSWGNDKCAKLLGFYEQELMAEMVPALGGDKVFVDIGAADGFYAVGALHAGLAQRTIAFELTENGRAVIDGTARSLGLRERIEILGACSEQGLMENMAGLDRSRMVMLCDVEGAEFDIFTDAVLASLAGAHIFIEVHDHSASGPAQYAALKERAQRWFRVQEIRKAGRNPYHYDELKDLDDTDHWLVCSEGRDPDQKWLALRPIHG